MTTEYILPSPLPAQADACDFIAARLELIKSLNEMFGTGSINCPAYVRKFHPLYLRYVEPNLYNEETMKKYSWYYDMIDDRIIFTDKNDYFYAKLVLVKE